MKTWRITLVVAAAVSFGPLAMPALCQEQVDEPEILPPPPGEAAPRPERTEAPPEPPLVREEVTLYGAAPLGAVPMHIRAMFESHARGEARRMAAIDNQRYILNHVAWLNGLPSTFGGSLDYAYSGLGGTFGYGGDVFEPWPYVPGDIWGYPFYDTVESPVGHRITWRGPNAYTYEPVYAGELKQPAPAVIEEEHWPLPEEGEQPIDPLVPPDAEPAAQPSVQALFAQEQFTDAAEALRIMIVNQRREDWDAGQQEQLAAGEFTRSLRSLEAAVADNRRNADLRLLLAWQYRLLGHGDAAIHQLDQALKIDANDAEAKVLRDEQTAEPNQEG